MLIIAHVCADFVDRKGVTLFRIKPEMLRTFLEVPDAVRDTLMFQFLLRDGSIKVPETKAEKKKLEQDPAENMAPDGKAEKPSEPAKAQKPPEAEEKPAEGGDGKETGAKGSGRKAREEKAGA